MAFLGIEKEVKAIQMRVTRSCSLWMMWWTMVVVTMLGCVVDCWGTEWRFRVPFNAARSAYHVCTTCPWEIEEAWEDTVPWSSITAYANNLQNQLTASGLDGYSMWILSKLTITALTSSALVSGRTKQHSSRGKGPGWAGGLIITFLGAKSSRRTPRSIKSIVNQKSMANIASDCASQDNRRQLPCLHPRRGTANLSQQWAPIAGHISCLGKPVG